MVTLFIFEKSLLCTLESLLFYSAPERLWIAAQLDLVRLTLKVLKMKWEHCSEWFGKVCVISETACGDFTSYGITSREGVNRIKGPGLYDSGEAGVSHMGGR